MPVRARPMSPHVTVSGPDRAGARRVYVDGVELVTVAVVHASANGPTFTLRLSRAPCAPLHHHGSLAAAMREALDVAQLYV